jgi:capsular exopolysaccharide synthesis family protein
MGRLHEAIDKAEASFSKSLVLKTAVRPKEKQSLVPQNPEPIKLNGDSNGFAGLKNKIMSQHPDRLIKTILFTGIRHGIGVTSTVIKFATSLAKTTGLKVLVIDANLKTPDLHRKFSIVNDRGMAELLTGDGNQAFQFKRVGQGQLYVFTCGKNCSEEISNFESDRFDKLLQAARDKFDYIILDSAPVTRFSETQTISKKVDGVILVIESGKTRRQVAQRAREELEKAAGDRLLGVVLNKRKFHIPEWIYKRL